MECEAVPFYAVSYLADYQILILKKIFNIEKKNDATEVGVRIIEDAKLSYSLSFANPPHWSNCIKPVKLLFWKFSRHKSRLLEIMTLSYEFLSREQVSIITLSFKI